MAIQRTDPVARFWAKVERFRGCWHWRGRKDRRGWGQFAPCRGKNLRPARYAWEATYGPVPEGMVVRHRCGFPQSCVRPDHLILGPRLVPRPLR
jgi:hypothetical protein